MLRRPQPKLWAEYRYSFRATELSFSLDAMKSSWLGNLLILTTTLLLAACGHGGCCQREASLTPMETADLDDSVMRGSVTAFLQETGAPVSSLYEFKRIDLDRDGRRDALVLFKNPYGYWCDTHGCTMLVMRAGSDKFELVNAIQPVRAPLYVSNTESNGWKDIIVRVTGRWDESKDVAMTYNGAQYADNPSTMPPYLLASNTAQPVFY